MSAFHGRSKVSSADRRAEYFGDRPDVGDGLRAAARSGWQWSAVQQVGARLTSMLIFLVLARLLRPTDFGTVALATIFVTLLQVLVEGGFGQAVIQRRHLLRGHVDTVFWTSVTTGVVLAAALVVAAGPLAHAFGQPKLAPVLRVLAIAVVASALGAAQAGLLRRSLRFKPLAVRAIVSNAVSGVAGLAAAFLGWGVWALVVQNLLLYISQTALLWVATGWRPGFDVSRRYFHDIFKFSRNSLGNSLLLFTNQRSDDFLVGSWLGPVSLGIYTVAYRLLSVMSDLVNQMMLTVTFPVFARIQDDAPRFRRAYGTVLRAAAAIAFPSYLFFVVSAPDVTRVLFGAKWDAAAPVMRILAVFGALQATLAITDSCLTAIGSPHIVFRNRLASTTVQVAAFAVAVHFGIEWVAFSLVARAYLMAPLPVWWLRKAGATTYREWASALAVPAVAASAMLGAMQAVRMALPQSMGAIAHLAVITPVGGLAYLAALWLLDRSLLRELLQFLRHRPEPRAAGGVHGKAVPAGARTEAGA